MGLRKNGGYFNTGQIIDSIFNWGMRDMGAPVLSAKLLAYMIFIDTIPSYALDYPHWCNLMGDPTVEVFVGTPKDINAEYAETVVPGELCYPVHADDEDGNPIENVVVTIVNDADLQLIMKTYAYGNAVFELIASPQEIFYEDPLTSTGLYTYYVEAEYPEGLSVPSNAFEIDVTTGIGGDVETPGFSTELDGNFPNPFTLSTNINYKVADKQSVKINIYNIRGQLIRTILNETKTPGLYEII